MTDPAKQQLDWDVAYAAENILYQQVEQWTPGWSWDRPITHVTSGINDLLVHRFGFILLQLDPRPRKILTIHGPRCYIQLRGVQ